MDMYILFLVFMLVKKPVSFDFLTRIIESTAKAEQDILSLVSSLVYTFSTIFIPTSCQYNACGTCTCICWHPAFIRDPEPGIPLASKRDRVYMYLERACIQANAIH